MGWGRALTFLPYGDQQRKHGRLAHEGLNPIALQAHQKLLEYEVVVLLQEIATTPDGFLNHLRRWVHLLACLIRLNAFLRETLVTLPANSSIYCMGTASAQLTTNTSEFLKLQWQELLRVVSQALKLWTFSLPVSCLSFFCVILPFVIPCTVLQLKAPSFSVKYIPAWLPGMAFKRHALRVRKDLEEMRNMLFDMATKYIVSLPQPDIHETSFSSSSRN